MAAAFQIVGVIVKIAKLLMGQLSVCSANRIPSDILGVQIQQNSA